MLLGYGIIETVNFSVASPADNSKIVAGLQVSTELCNAFLTKSVSIGDRAIDVNSFGPVFFNRLIYFRSGEESVGKYCKYNRGVLINYRYGDDLRQLRTGKFPFFWQRVRPNLNIAIFSGLLIGRGYAMIAYNGVNKDEISRLNAGGEKWSNRYVSTELASSSVETNDSLPETKEREDSRKYYKPFGEPSNAAGIFSDKTITALLIICGVIFIWIGLTIFESGGVIGLSVGILGLILLLEGCLWALRGNVAN